MLPITMFQVTQTRSADPGSLVLRGIKEERPTLICGTRESKEAIRLAPHNERGFELQPLIHDGNPYLKVTDFIVEVDWRSVHDPARDYVNGTVYLVGGRPAFLVKRRSWHALVTFDGTIHEADNLQEMIGFTSWQIAVRLPDREPELLVHLNFGS